MGKTSIAWTDASWNPTRGCTRVSAGCQHCFAERIAARFSTHSDQDGDEPGGVFAGFAEMTEHGPRWTGKVELIPHKLEEPLRWRKPKRIFVNSMSDLFHESLADADLDQVFAVMALAPHHTYQVLTKRPERMLRYLSGDHRRGLVGHALFTIKHAHEEGPFNTALFNRPWPLLNVWLGVSVEDQKTADHRIPLLLQTPAAKTFVSYEPALEPVDFECYPSTTCPTGWLTDERHLDWVIVGGESGPGARPFNVSWARSTVKQCKAAGVSVFVKQIGSQPRCIDVALAEWGPHVRWVMAPEGNTGKPLGLRARKGDDPAEWPEDLRVQEFPCP